MTGGPDKPPRPLGVHEVNFQGEQDKLMAAIEALQRNAGAMIQYNDCLAKLRKRSYDSHITAGFTPAEALELCKNVIG